MGMIFIDRIGEPAPTAGLTRDDRAALAVQREVEERLERNPGRR